MNSFAGEFNPRDSKLRDQWHTETPAGKNLLSAHLQTYPNSFPHENNFYSADVGLIARRSAELRETLEGMSEFRDIEEKRSTLSIFEAKVRSDIKIKSYRMDFSELNDFSDMFLNRIKEVGPQYLDHTRSFLARMLDDYLSLRKEGNPWTKLYEQTLVSYVLAYGISDGKKTLENYYLPTKLREGHLDFLKEAKVWQAAVDSLGASIKSKSRRQLLQELAIEVLGKWGQKLGGSNKEEVTILPKGSSLSFHEVHPDLAVLRGYVGNDCATSCSFGFPYSPYERTFYISDESKRVLGYVSFSIVTVEGARTIFLHTIAGPSITSGLTEFIVVAFDKTKYRLVEADSVYLPEDHRIDENVNYSAIKIGMQRLVKDSRIEPVHWLDRKIRFEIGRHGSDMFYDDPNRNSMARRVQDPSYDVVTEVRTIPYESPLRETNNFDSRDSTSGKTSGKTMSESKAHLKSQEPLIPEDFSAAAQSCRLSFKKTALQNRNQ